MRKNIRSKLYKRIQTFFSRPMSSRTRLLALLLSFIFIGTLLISFSSANSYFASSEAENNNVSLGCIPKVINDTTASGGGAVRFGSNSLNELGLDSCGKTIPSHDYPIPTTGRVIYMSPKGADKDSLSVDGNDANSGLTESAPVETITAAYNKLKTNNTTGGGAIVLRGGKYRSWHKTSDGTRAAFMTDINITMQAYRSEKPWFVGTDEVGAASWEVAGTNLWRQRWETPHFCKSHLNAGQVFEGQEIGYRAKIPGLVIGSRVKPITSGTSDKVEPFDSQSGIAMRYSNSLGVRVDTPRVCAHPDTYYINTNRLVDIDSDPQMMFANDVEIPQRKTLIELSTKPSSFYYDWDNQYVYTNKDPASNTLEITKRHAIANFSNGYSFQWKGIGVKRFASSPLHAVIYAGLGGADVAGGEFIVENSVFSENSGATIDISGPKNNTAIKRSVFARNKYAGFGSNGFASRGDVTKTNKLLIEGSVFSENNTGLNDTACGASCGVAAVKLNNMVGYTVKNSIFENTRGRNAPGLWCDIDCSNGIMVNNIMRNNTGPGIFYEISSKGIIAGNLVYHNDFANIKVLASSTKVYNNTVINKAGPNVEAVWISDDSRPAPDKGETWPYTRAAMEASHASLGVGYAVRVGPNTNAVEFANNLIVSQEVKGARLLNFMNSSIPYAPNTNSPDFFKVLNNNIYYRLSGQPLYGWLTNGNILSATDLRSVSGQAWEQSSIDIIGTGDPFISRKSQNFQLNTDSQAYINKQPIPIDVAAAMGLPTTQEYPRGAITWPR
jgi:parallel beta-helix repeat protein